MSQSLSNLKPGLPAPSFSAPDANGEIVRLTDYRGKKVVLYFYPKDDTPGFTVEYNLPFRLVADVDKKISRAYGVLNEERGMDRRVTFLIDAQGRIEKIFDPVKADQHPAEVVGSLTKP